MTSEEIKEIINLELQVEVDIKNVHGLDLTKCLIEPIKQKYKNANDPNKVYEIWTVLEEAGNGNGYKIYYDDETKMFGLGIKSNKDEFIDIGRCRTFLEALNSI